MKNLIPQILQRTWPSSRRRVALLMILIIPFLTIQSCDYDHPGPVIFDNQTAAMVLAWNSAIQEAYTFDVGIGLPPPVISRLFAMYHVAMHDAVNAVKPKYQTYVYQLTDKKADADAAVAQAVYEVLLAIGPKDEAFQTFEELYQTSMGYIRDGDKKNRGIALGKEVAKAVLATRASDAPFLLLGGYNPTPPSGTNPGEFQYFPPLNTYALAGFHLQQPWAISSANQFRQGPPDPISSSAYAKDYLETKTLGAKGSTERSADQTAIGIFWAENSSRGWNSVARSAIENKKPNINGHEAARLFALLHIAIADGYISVFDSKMHYYYWRPNTAVHLGDFDGNDETVGDPAWEAELVVPGVGEYPSAHALTGAAAAQILIRFFQTQNVPITTTSGYWPGTRSYPNLTSAVRENSLSRIYIGYHFRKAIDVGEASGYEIGDYVFDHALRPK